MRTLHIYIEHPAFSCQRTDCQGNEKVWSGLDAQGMDMGTQEWNGKLYEKCDEIHLGLQHSIRDAMGLGLILTYHFGYLLQGNYCWLF